MCTTRLCLLHWPILPARTTHLLLEECLAVELWQGLQLRLQAVLFHNELSAAAVPVA